MVSLKGYEFDRLKTLALWFAGGVTKSKSSSNVPNSYLNEETNNARTSLHESSDSGGSNNPTSKIVESKSMYSAKLADICPGANTVQFNVDNNQVDNKPSEQNNKPNGRHNISFEDEYPQNYRHNFNANQEEPPPHNGINNKETATTETNLVIKHEERHSNSSTSGVSSPSDSSQRDGFK